MEDEVPQPRKRGRLKDIDRDLIWRLASIMCTYKEISEVVGLPEKTIKNNFADLIEKGRSVGKKSLRRAQFEKAIQDKDPRLLIFLGKNYLSQKENPDDKESNTPLPWNEDL